MNALALILFVPWFLVLGSLFWLLPKQSPRSGWRNRFDALTLVLALVLSVIGMLFGMHTETPGVHPIWKQVLATLYAYGAFLAVLMIGIGLRSRFGSR